MHQRTPMDQLLDYIRATVPEDRVEELRQHIAEVYEPLPPELEADLDMRLERLDHEPKYSPEEVWAYLKERKAQWQKN